MLVFFFFADPYTGKNQSFFFCFFIASESSYVFGIKGVMPRLVPFTMSELKDASIILKKMKYKIHLIYSLLLII